MMPTKKDEESGTWFKPPEAPSDLDQERLYQEAFYNWLLLNGVDIMIKGSEMNSSSMGNLIIAEVDMPKLKAAIQGRERKARIRELTWVDQNISNEMFDDWIKNRLSELTKEEHHD